jgi:hypothetical protein
VLTAPEEPGTQKVIYTARLHPELARPGKLLLSYDVNSLNTADNYADARLYRPRFVELDWPLPQPDRSAVPTSPADLTVTSDSAGVAHLTWTAVAGATAYRVHRRDVTGGQTHLSRQSVGAARPRLMSGLITGHGMSSLCPQPTMSGRARSRRWSRRRCGSPPTPASSGWRTPRRPPGTYFVRPRQPGCGAGVAAFAAELAAQSAGPWANCSAHPRSINATESRAIDLAGHRRAGRGQDSW